MSKFLFIVIIFKTKIIHLLADFKRVIAVVQECLAEQECISKSGGSKEKKTRYPISFTKL